MQCLRAAHALSSDQYGYIPVHEGYILVHEGYIPVHAGYIPVHEGYMQEKYCLCNMTLLKNESYVI
jgi:hypothetical protein